MNIFVKDIDSYFKNVSNKDIYKLIFDLGYRMGIEECYETNYDKVLISYFFDSICIESNDYCLDKNSKLVSGTYKEIFDFLVDKIKN